jgi:hypothetical protein
MKRKKLSFKKITIAHILSNQQASIFGGEKTRGNNCQIQDSTANNCDDVDIRNVPQSHGINCMTWKKNCQI